MLLLITAVFALLKCQIFLSKGAGEGINFAINYVMVTEMI